MTTRSSICLPANTSNPISPRSTPTAWFQRSRTATGPCGHEFVRCDQFKIATKPLPANYMHADFKNLDAVAPAMGNHLIDPTSPEFNGKKFTRTRVYGVYDGRVTFVEEMLTREYMLSQPAACFPIKSPPAVRVRGYYPSQSCTRYHPQANEYTVSMEGFTLREAIPVER